MFTVWPSVTFGIVLPVVELAELLLLAVLLLPFVVHLLASHPAGVWFNAISLLALVAVLPSCKPDSSSPIDSGLSAACNSEGTALLLSRSPGSLLVRLLFADFAASSLSSPASYRSSRVSPVPFMHLRVFVRTVLGRLFVQL